VNIAEMLLLNAGASVLTVQALLGHKRVDTTLRYARVYDSTVAADYARAVSRTERCLGLSDGLVVQPAGTGSGRCPALLPSHRPTTQR
jgi:hypothetical protein